MWTMEGTSRQRPPLFLGRLILEDTHLLNVRLCDTLATGGLVGEQEWGTLRTTMGVNRRGTQHHLYRESIWEGKSRLPKTKKGYRKVVLTDGKMKVLREYKEKDFPNAHPDAWVLPGKRGRPIDLGCDVKTHQTARPQGRHSRTSLTRATTLEQLAHVERGS